MQLRQRTTKSFSAILLLSLLVNFMAPAVLPVAAERRPARSSAPGTQQDALLDQIGGAVHAVALSDEFVVAGMGPQVIVLDVSDPHAPTVLGRSGLLTGVVQRLYVIGAHVVVLTADQGLFTLSLATPGAPVVEASFPLPSGEAVEMVVGPRYAYVLLADVSLASPSEKRLAVIDLADPVAPVLVAELHLSDWNSVVGMALNEEFLFVAAGRQIYPYTLADPAAPAAGAPLQFEWNIAGLAQTGALVYARLVNDDGATTLQLVDRPDASTATAAAARLYVGAGHELRVYDPADPTVPRLLARMQMPDTVHGFVVQVTDAADRLFVAAGDAGVRIVRVPTASPPPVATVAADADVHALAVDGTRLYALVGADELRIFDVGNPAQPVMIKRFFPGRGDLQTLAAQADAVYLGGYGLFAYDMRDPTAPVETFRLDDRYITPTRLVVADNMLFMLGYLFTISVDGYGLVMYDLADPRAPRAAGSYITAHGAQYGFGPAMLDVAKGDNRLYIVHDGGIGATGLTVLDIDNPAEPQLMARLGVSGPTVGIAAADGHLFTATAAQDWSVPSDLWPRRELKGLRTFSRQANGVPAPDGVFRDCPGATRIAAGPGRVYLGCGEDGLHVFDVTDPAQPRALTSALTAGTVVDLALAGDFLYVAEGAAGLSVYATDAFAPVEVGAYGELGSVIAVNQVGGRLYASPAAGGLTLLTPSADAVTVADHLPLMGQVTDLLSLGDQLFASAGSEGILRMRVATSGRPVPERVYGTGDAPSALVDVDGRIFAAAGFGGLLLLDPTAETASSGILGRTHALVGAATTAEPSIGIPDPWKRSHDVEMLGGFLLEVAEDVDSPDPNGAYLWGNSLLSRDVTTPENSALVSISTAQPIGRQGALVGQVYYSFADSLTLVDARDPAALHAAGVYMPTSAVADLFQVGHYAYLAEGTAGIEVLDVSDPLRPVHRAQIDTPGKAQAVVVLGEAAFVADGDGGVVVLHVPTPQRTYLPAIAGRYASAPLLYLPLDEPTGSTILHDAAGGLLAGCTGATCPAVGQPGRSGRALGFDGVNDVVSLGNPAQLDRSGQLTIMAWIHPTSLDGLRNIVAHGYTSDPKREVVLRINDGFYEIGSWDGVSHSVRAPAPAEDLTQWVFLAGVYDGCAWRLYRNGVQIAARADATGALTVPGGWALGSRGDGTERFFRGGIDEVVIYGRGLSAAEIAARFAGAWPE